MPDDLFGTIPKKNMAKYDFFFSVRNRGNGFFSIHIYYVIFFLHPTHFIVPPMVWIPQQLVGTPVGYNVTLECFIEAYPISLNYWSKDDGDMIHDSNKFK